MPGRSRVISARIVAAVGLLALAASSKALAQGSIISGVVRANGTPVSSARAILDTGREVRTDSVGHFRFMDVAPGRHVLAVLSLGTTPYSVNVIVAANDTVDFEVALVKSVVLDSVLIEGSTVRQEFVRAYAERKRMGIGKFMDSMEVRRFPGMRQALLFIPGVRCMKTCDTVYFTGGAGALCLPNVWIDKQNWGRDQEVLRPMQPGDVMAVEVYTRESLVPDEFKQRGIERGCGALVIWTKRFWPQGKGKPR